MRYTWCGGEYMNCSKCDDCNDDDDDESGGGGRVKVQPHCGIGHTFA